MPKKSKCCGKTIPFGGGTPARGQRKGQNGAYGKVDNSMKPYPPELEGPLTSGLMGPMSGGMMGPPMTKGY
jgi:hypothetical protein